ncbi:hypothetical protein CIG19_20815 [Enterobacterales bacterium CwR94]|nr:hypothetical protein CIG19_20815 [Enterobacterales bacterium CwR94]
MNQAIQFPDREIYDAALQAIVFPALVNGFQVKCAISFASLDLKFGEGDPLNLFLIHRWDLEEEAEQAIKNECFDSQGWVWLS